MSLLAGVGGDAFLQALEGTALVLNRDGRIEAYNRERWNRFASENGAPALALPANVLGKPLLDFITGDEPRAWHQAVMRGLLESPGRSVIVEYRCDAPELRRDMRMAVTTLVTDGHIVGTLWHSVALATAARPRIGLLAPHRATPEPESLPVLAMCSYCKQVRFPPGEAAGSWVTAERYYQLGGSEAVRLGHGVCPDCRRTLSELIRERRREVR